MGEVLSVCQLVSEPERFSGKRVAVMGRVVEHKYGTDLRDPSDKDCDSIALISYPGIQPARFTLIEDRNYQDMSEALQDAWIAKPGLPSVDFRVFAVLQGRFDSQYRVVNGNRVLFAWWLGNFLDRYHHHFVLHRVVEVKIVSSEDWRRHDQSIAAAMLKTEIEPTDWSEESWPPLHLAILENDTPDVLIGLVRAGTDPNARGKDGRTPLHLAAGFNDNPAIIETLVEIGADPMAQTEAGWAPIHFAAYLNRNPSIIAALVEAGSDPNTVGVEGNLTPLHFAAANNSNAAVINALVEAGADLKAQSERGFTPLDLAALENSNPAVISALVEARADPTVRSVYGFTPLDLAVSNNNAAVVTTLVRAGSKVRARVESSDDSYEDSSNPLVYAISLKLHLATIAGLVEAEADPTNQTYGSLPHLCTAAALNGNPAVIKTLVEAGADPSVRSENGFTPLHFAAASNYNPAVIKTLVEAGADPSVRSENGFTPLHFAVASNYRWSVSIIGALRDVGVDPRIRNDAGKLPWDYVEGNSRIPKDNDIYRWLKEASLSQVVE